MKKEEIYKAIRNAGYSYASSCYEGLYENICEDAECEEYFDENKHPYEDYFREYVLEQSNQTYIDCGPEGYITNEFEIEGISVEDLRPFLSENLYDILWDGIERFIQETYK